MASRSQKSRNIVPFEPATASAQALPAVCVGHVVSFDPDHGPMVDFPGNPAGPAIARLLVALDAATLQGAAASRTPCALLFERGDARLPLLVGIVRPGPVSSNNTATVDGKRVVLTGEEEIELRCGEASISLKKNGKLVIRGAYVETRAKGTNRIKGGSVQIN